MARRYFNWKLAVVLLIGAAVLAVTAFGLRQWQRAGRAEHGLALGNKAYDEHKWEEAANNLGRYLSVAENDVPVLLKYAEAQLNIRPVKSGHVQQAVASYRIVLRVDPNNSEAAKQLTGLYLAIGAPGEAELIAKRYLDKNKNPELCRLLAIAMARQRKFDEAASQLKAIIKEHSEQILAYETLGQLTEQRPENFPGQPDYWYNEAVKNNPSSALAYAVRAEFYLKSKDKSKAVADLEQAEKLNLTDLAVRLRLAAAYLNVGFFDKAEEQLSIAQKIEPTNEAVWQAWAKFAFKSQLQTKMLKVAEAGLKELSAQPWDFMPVAAELFIRAGQYDRAADCISQLRQKDVAPAATAFLEGLLADRKGQGYEAVKCWRHAIELGNKSAQIRLMLASGLAGLGDIQAAAGQLRLLVSEQPDSFEGHMALARLLTQTGNFAEAAEHARRAAELSPANPAVVSLCLQTRLQLLAAQPKGKSQTLQGASDTAENSAEPNDVKSQLAWLKKATNESLEVRLLELQLALQQGNFTDANMIIVELKKSYPSEMEVSIAEVNLLTAQDKTDDAIAVLNRAIEKFPQAVRPVRYLAILCTQEGKYEICETVIGDAMNRIEQPVSQRELGLLLADLYTLWKNEEKAYKLLEGLAQKLPNDIPVKRRLLGCPQVVKNSVEAEQLVADIKSLEGQDGWQWRYEQAKVWFAGENFKDKYPQILSLLKENLLAHPDDQISRMLLAASYERGNELQLAISAYREALARRPNDIRIIVPLVAALYKANEYDSADELLGRAESEKLVHPELKKLELRSHLRRGELDYAGDVLQSLLTSDPNNRSICLSLALLQMRQNKFVEAGELLGKLKNQEPNSLAVAMAQIELNIRQGKPAEALLLCDRIADERRSASAYILRGRTYAMLRRSEKAIENFEHATVVEPNNNEAWVIKSDFYRALGRTSEATDAVQKALSLSPKDIQIQKRAISLLLQSGNADKVRQRNALLDNALQANPEDGELKILKARSLLTVGTAPAIKEAKNILRTLAQNRPEISEAWLLLGEQSLRDGNPGQAMDVALQGLAHHRNDKMLLVLKSQAEAARSPALAIPTLKVLRELDPNSVETAVLLSSAYVGAGEPEKAVALLDSQAACCKTDADTRKVRIALAAAAYKNGDKVRSEEIFDSLYKSNPNDAGVLLVESRLLKDSKLWDQIILKTKHWCQDHQRDTVTAKTIAGELSTINDSQAKNAAEELLRAVLANNSECTEAMSALGMLLHNTGRSSEAEILYQRILKLQPDNLTAINNLAWIMCEEHGKYQQALALAQSGLAKAPDYVDLIDTRGVIYYRLGEFNKAIEDFGRCIELYPAESPSIAASYYHLGRALAGIRQKDKAEENFKKALELNEKVKGLSDADISETRRILKNLQGEGV